jgi:dipeptidyl-peptidase-4
MVRLKSFTLKRNIEDVHTVDGLTLENIVITSERSGWNQIYNVNLKSHELTALTKGNFAVKKFLHLDKKNEVLYFTASGKEKGNPYYNYAYRVNLDGSDLTLLTPEMFNHDVYIEPGAKYFIDNYSTPSQPTTSVLRSTKDGSIILTIASTNTEELFATGWQPPQIFSTVAKDKKTEIYGAIWKPTNFDSRKKYPVIDSSYTGPHTHVVPNSFSCSNRYGFGCRSVLNSTNQALAELGFVVVRVDGLGTIGRSKTFQNWSYRKLGYGLEDHVLAIKELAKRYAWIDSSRVGIFGHSAGGYDATQGLLRFPDFYSVAVSSSADHDHRMEKAWWPEMYMGWPVGEAYHEQSNITMAGNLKGKLLITHGGIDENVNPSATFKLAEALVKADKDFDMLIFPSSRHGYSVNARNYFIKKRWNYFIEHLLGIEPSWPIHFPN